MTVLYDTATVTESLCKTKSKLYADIQGYLLIAVLTVLSAISYFINRFRIGWETLIAFK